MGRSRRVALVLGGVAFATVVIVASAATIYWRSQAGRLDNMRQAVAAFEPPDQWVGWTQVGGTSRGYSPFCIDVECPSYSERYVVAVPEGDVGLRLEAAIQAMDVGLVGAPGRVCVAGARCLYTVDGDGFTVDIVLADPFDFERETVDEIPAGFIEVTVNLHAY